MKPGNLLCLFFIFSAMIACKRTEVNPQTPKAKLQTSNLLLGKWSLVKDSTSTQFTGSLIDSHQYKGNTGDYYDFNTNGKCYISENGALDTIVYKIVSDNGVVFGTSGYTSSVDPLTVHSAKITFALPQGPGMGFNSKAVYLKK
jgi:hypothetical protein